MSLTTFSFPTRTIFGAGALRDLPANLGKLAFRRPLVVTDGGVLKTEAFAALAATWSYLAPFMFLVVCTSTS